MAKRRIIIIYISCSFPGKQFVTAASSFICRRRPATTPERFLSRFHPLYSVSIASSCAIRLPIFFHSSTTSKGDGNLTVELPRFLIARRRSVFTIFYHVKEQFSTRLVRHGNSDYELNKNIFHSLRNNLRVSREN